MNIGIDISQIVYKGTGVSRFTEGLVQGILEYDKKHNWTFFFSGRQELPITIESNIHSKGQKLVKWPIPPRVLSFLWNDLHNYSKLLTLNSQFLTKLDWFITSDWTEPSIQTKKATIIHDLVFKKHPETVHDTILKTQQKRLNWVQHESDLIFADSQSTADDLKKYYKIDSKKIVINYPGVDEPMQMDRNFITEIKSNFRIPDTFILTVGKLEPRKNLERLIQAYNLLQKKHTKLPALVIVGMHGWDTDIQKHDDIILPGYVNDEILTALYQSALCFVYPSIYEGFGYPVVEAMINKCPVLTSNTSSLIELAKNKSALTFDPLNVEDIAEQLEKIINNQNLRTELIKNGEKRAIQFTWKNYVATLLKNLEKKL
ncbi:MAG TPA: glycosyltransferase family 1 protein [Candidatus Woesebacteria bacterium]|nr:glycosyltransferase family 1 protein [Candidatus Woesebacteria bacterium]